MSVLDSNTTQPQQQRQPQQPLQGSGNGHRSPQLSTYDWDYLIQPDRVHRLIYTDPEIFQQEMIRIFGGVWVYLAHESEIPNPNDFKTTQLGFRPIIVLRDSKDNLRGFFNRCTHRGATLCREAQGSARTFTCPYHGWTYNSAGELTGIPWSKNAYPPDLDRAELGLGQIRVASYRGFIFGTLNPEMPDLPIYLGRAGVLLDQWLDRYPNANLKARSRTHSMIYQGNWKFNYDNAADGYHVAFSHRSLLMVAGRLGEQKDMQYFAHNPDDSPMYVQYLGNGHVFLDQRPSYEKEAGVFWQQQRPQPGREIYEAQVREKYGEKADELLDLAIGSQMNLTIFPNLLLVGNQIQVIEPLAVDRTQLTIHATLLEDVPEDINTLRMRTQEDFPNFGIPDDLMNFAECHRGLSIPELEWVVTNRGYNVPDRQYIDDNGILTGPVTDELPLRNFYQEWKRLMSGDLKLTAYTSR